jgi:hypothetical protein
MMLIEEILARDPRASELESACRHIRRSEKFKFVPTIGEVLKIITEQEHRWSDRWSAGEAEIGDDGEGGGIPAAYQWLEELLAEAEESREKQKAKLEQDAAIDEAVSQAGAWEREAKVRAKAIEDVYVLGVRQVAEGLPFVTLEQWLDDLPRINDPLEDPTRCDDERVAYWCGCFEGHRFRWRDHDERPGTEAMMVPREPGERSRWYKENYSLVRTKVRSQPGRLTDDRRTD